MATAIVYNPLKTLELPFDGKHITIPGGIRKENGEIDDKACISRIKDQTFRGPDEYKRYRPGATGVDRNAEMEFDIDGLSFANRILNRHFLNYLDAGVLVSETMPTDEQMKMAKMKCHQWKLKAIDEALQEREQRRAGGQGKLTLDDHIIEWMVELNVEDKMYNPNPKAQSDQDMLVAAVAAGVKAAMAAVK